MKSISEGLMGVSAIAFAGKRCDLNRSVAKPYQMIEPFSEDEVVFLPSLAI